MHDGFRAARDLLLSCREDYEAACAHFSWPKLDRFNWALDWFDAIAKGPRRDRTALWIASENGTETRLSFAELSARSSQIANFLRSLGVRRGDRILLMLGNVPQLWETLLAAIKLGAVVSPTTTLLEGAELAERISRGGIRHMIAAAPFAPRFEAFAGCTRIAVGGLVPGWHDYEKGYAASSDFEPNGDTRASDPMQLYFTSGTTNKSKLVLHTHTTYPVGHLSTMYWIGLKPGDIHCNISSPGWAKHAWSCFFAPWNAEATVFVANQSRFDARTLLRVLSQRGVTTFCAPPTVWRMLVQENLRDYTMSFRELVSAGEPLNPEVIEQVKRAWGIMIRDGWGQTETSLAIGNSPGQPIKTGSVGRPMPGFQVVLLNRQGNEDSEGEACLKLDPRPLGVMAGYQSESGELAPITGPVYRTSDVMSRDADGFFTFVGRADDVFKASDYRISPFELESALIEHADVAECAVVPSPDPIRLTVPKAFIVLRLGVEPSREAALSIFQHVRKVLAPYKRIRRLEFSELPKTVSGKIRRIELRTREAATEASPRPQHEFREEDFPEL